MRAFQEKPSPGTKEAQEAGCTCPVIDNHHGAGVGGQGDVFWYNGECPLHGIMFGDKHKLEKLS